MTEKQSKLYIGLKRLFSRNAVIRHIGNKKVKVVDTDSLQIAKALSGKDKYNRIRQKYGIDYSQIRAGFQQDRLALFKDFEVMSSDPIISSALSIYADECTTPDEYGNMLTINSDNESIKEILDNLFFDILNIEFNLWTWIRGLCKYGDVFLQLELHEEFGIINVIPLSVYDVERIDGENIDNPNEYYFIVQGDRKNKIESFEIAHFRMVSDSNFLPYGVSMIEGARRPWKQLSLMEDAMLIHRIMRAPEKRIFKIDIGNIPPDEVDTYMSDIITKMKKTPYIDPATGDYNLKFNMQNLLEDFFLPVRGGDTGTEIDTLSGMTFDTIEDIEYIKDRMMAALTIPKAFLGFTESIEGKATLAALDLRFARTIERIQRMVLSTLNEIAIIHLYAQGYKDEELVNFELDLTNPSLIYEEEKLAIWGSKVSLARDIQDLKMLSTDYIYEKIFNMTEDEINKMRAGVIKDQKRKYRHEQIESEGNDPITTGQSFGTPHDLAMIGTEGEEESSQDGAGEEAGHSFENKQKNNKTRSQLADDLLGADEMHSAVKMDKSSYKHRYRGNNPLNLEGLSEFLDKKNKKEIIT